MWKIKFSIFMCAVFLVTANEENPRENRIVPTPQGPVRGYKDPETNVFEFHGIPYATAPKGQDRYKAPLPPPAWLQTFDAINKRVVCPQSRQYNVMLSEGLNVQEDCLVANVYVPDTKEDKLSVLVYVHGGAFEIGYGDAITTKQMIKNKKIIAVTFNYRLGVHGFLCLGTENIPGNAGMKDQVALLRWVKKNIASYGGNPDDVTIAGYSAGSVSVDLLQLSPSARGLFNKVIPESGSNIGVIAVQTNPLERAKSHARSLNFLDVDDVYALENFYMSTSLETLMTTWNMTEPDSTFGFVPCVERPTGEEIFLADAPQNILKSGKFRKLPMLYGFANMEGLFRTPLFGIWKDKMNEKFSDFLPADLQFDNEKQKEELAKKVKKLYFGDQPVSVNTMQAYVDYFTDVLFAYGALASLKLQLSAGNHQIYLYVYSFVNAGGTPTGYENYTMNGANHCAQSVAIGDWAPFSGLPHEDSLSDDYKKNKATLREMWSNFIITGKPVPEGSSLPAWPPMGKDWSPHMVLGNTVELQASLLKERMLFWEEIYKQYYRSPVPPPTPPTRHSEL